LANSIHLGLMDYNKVELADKLVVEDAHFLEAANFLFEKKLI